MNNSLRNRFILLSVISVLALIWSFLWPTGNKLVIGVAYADIADGTEITAYRELNYEGFSDENSNSQRINGGTAYFNLRWDNSNLTGLMIKPTNGLDSVLFNFMNIYLSQNMWDTPVCQLNGMQVMESFDITDGEFGIDEAG